jgi:hypothetical protein
LFILFVIRYYGDTGLAHQCEREDLFSKRKHELIIILNGWYKKPFKEKPNKLIKNHVNNNLKE